MSHSQQSTSDSQRGRGRPKAITGDAVRVGLRLSEEQRAKLDRLGGAAWVRKKIDEAREPREPKHPLAPWQSTED
jgi:ribosomal protein L19